MTFDTTFDTFLFDLDGTLIDSVDDLTTAANLLRAELDLAPLEAEVVRGYVGDGATLLVKRSLPEGLFSEERLQRFLELYGDHLLDRTVAYPGIRKFLEMHPGKKMAVVTNKPLRFALRLLEALELLPFFPVVVAPEVRTCFCAFGIGRDDGIPFDFLARSPADLARLFPPEAR
jgi:phosphoglycolate phosphatase